MRVLVDRLPGDVARHASSQIALPRGTRVATGRPMFGGVKSFPTHFYHPRLRDRDLDDGAPVYDRGSSIDSWIVPTFLSLRRSGKAVTLGPDLPPGGVVFVSSYSVPGLRLPGELYVVSLLADGFVHPRPDFTVVQNAEQLPFCAGGSFMPHWPEPSLRPRDRSRGTTISRMAYFGNLRNLAPAFADPSFARELRARTGVTFATPAIESWGDYREVDLALSLRARGLRVWHGCKPATKLYNAWLAGVPLVGDLESAMANVAVPGLDYVLGADRPGVLEAVAGLVAAPERYNGFLSRAEQRAADHRPQRLDARWAALVDFVEWAARGRVAAGPAERSRRRLLAWLYRLKRRATI